MSTYITLVLLLLLLLNVAFDYMCKFVIKFVDVVTNKSLFCSATFQFLVLDMNFHVI